MCDVIVAWCENTWILNLTFFRTKGTSESSLPSRLSRCDANLLCCWLCQYHIILLGLVFSDSQRMETWQSAEMLQCVVKISSLFSQPELCYERTKKFRRRGKAESSVKALCVQGKFHTITIVHIVCTFFHILASLIVVQCIPCRATALVGAFSIHAFRVFH